MINHFGFHSKSLLNMSFGRFVIALSLLAIPFLVIGQKSKIELEKEKQRNLKRIAEAQTILEETKTAKKSSIGRLNAINKQIDARKDLIESMSDEIAFINKQMSANSIVIESMQDDLDQLKSEYSNMIYTAYKAKSAHSRLSFLLSSESYNQFFMRLKYMEQYTFSRKNQVRMIEDVRNELLMEFQELEQNKAEKNELLEEQKKEQQKLAGLLKKQKKEVISLRNKENDLKKEITRRERNNAKLEKLIADLVKEEMRKAEALNRKSEASSASFENSSTLFEKQKNRLPWPVSTGFISGHFGQQPHPVLKRVKVNNIGVIIQTRENEKVKAVYKGKVSRVAVVPGDLKNVVIVQHGEYFTVYTRLKEVNVKRGQLINVDDLIGIVNTDGDGNSELEFQVWKNNKKLDPELWLTKK